MDGPRLGFAMKDVPRLFRKTGAHVVEILPDIIVQSEKKLVQIGFGWLRGGFLFLPGLGLLLLLFFVSLEVHGTSMGQFLHRACATGRAGDLFLGSLFLIALKAREPALETVVAFADQIVDNHTVEGQRFVLRIKSD